MAFTSTAQLRKYKIIWPAETESIWCLESTSLHSYPHSNSNIEKFEDFGNMKITKKNKSIWAFVLKSPGNFILIKVWKPCRLE